jgi:hypothetical protein
MVLLSSLASGDDLVSLLLIPAGLSAVVAVVLVVAASFDASVIGSDCRGEELADSLLLLDFLMLTMDSCSSSLVAKMA